MVVKLNKYAEQFLNRRRTIKHEEYCIPIYGIWEV